MRCKILCFESGSSDIIGISQTLNTLSYSTSHELITEVEAIEGKLREGTFDFFLISSDDATLLSVARLLKKMILPYKLSSLFLLHDMHSAIRSELLEHGANHVIPYSVGSDMIAATMDLIVQKDRYKSELTSMGSFMKEASVIFDADKDNFFVSSVNKAFLDLDGLRLEDLLGKELQESQSCFNLSYFTNEIREVYATGIPVHMPNYHYMRDDLREWSDVYIYKPNNEQVSLIASPQTEIKRIQDKAEASKRYLQTILNAQAHIIYITDGSRLINTNKAFLDFFGFETMHDFVKKHTCTSELFERSDEAGYIDAKSEDWLNKVAADPQSIYKIRIKKAQEMIVFVPSVQEVIIDEKKQHVVILTDITELEDEKEKLRVVAMTDQLTGAANRFKFNTVIDEQVAISRRYTSELSVILFDVDDFKKINENFTHKIGDEVLKSIAKIAGKALRESDLFVRWGGEEFLILLPNTSLDQAQLVAEKMRHALEHYDFNEVGRVTCSFGCSALKAADTVSTLLSRVDEAVYQAKKAGRNCLKVGV